LISPIAFAGRADRVDRIRPKSKAFQHFELAAARPAAAVLRLIERPPDSPAAAPRKA
jgi:hypothetical protein